MKKQVIAVVGPTAVGKTRLSIEIAKRFNGEVISGDSMQVYQYFDIGTAKVLPEETQGIAHHLIDILPPNARFSAADFKQYVEQYIEQITMRHQIPIIAGGSGMYIQAALYNYNFAKNRYGGTVAKQLEKQLNLNGVQPLYQYLKKIDPNAAKKIHPNNHRRLIRAIEIYETTGKTMTEHQQEQKESVYQPILIGLDMERSLLYERINERIDIMMESGLLAEVKDLYHRYGADVQAMRGIGYKEFIPYFDGNLSLDGAVEQLKQNSRRFAKRQYTWFKNKMNVHWYSITPMTASETFSNILNDLAGLLREK